MTMNKLVLALLAVGVQAHAAVVGFSPASKTVNLGDTFSIDVEASAFASNLDGGGLNLAFNPAVVHVQGITIDGTAWDFLPTPGTIDNVAGTVNGTTFNQFAHPKVGAFPVLSYQFLAVGTGVSTLTHSEFSGNPFASGGSVVAVTFTDGQISVVPEPATTLLWGVGLMATLGLARLRQRQP